MAKKVKVLKKTKKIKKVVKPLLCYVCQDPNNPIRKNRDVYIQTYPKKIARHNGCFPGSLAWMESDLVKSNPEKKRYFENSKDFRKSEEVKETLKVALKDNSHPGNDLLEQFYSTNDKQEKKRIRRLLRKKGIFISNLKNPKRAKNKSSKVPSSKIKTKTKD